MVPKCLPLSIEPVFATMPSTRQSCFIKVICEGPMSILGKFNTLGQQIPCLRLQRHTGPLFARLRKRVCTSFLNHIQYQPWCCIHVADSSHARRRPPCRTNPSSIIMKHPMIFVHCSRQAVQSSKMSLKPLTNDQSLIAT